MVPIGLLCKRAAYPEVARRCKSVALRYGQRKQRSFLLPCLIPVSCGRMIIFWYVYRCSPWLLSIVLSVSRPYTEHIFWAQKNGHVLLSCSSSRHPPSTIAPPLPMRGTALGAVRARILTGSTVNEVFDGRRRFVVVRGRKCTLDFFVEHWSKRNRPKKRTRYGGFQPHASASLGLSQL